MTLVRRLALKISDAVVLYASAGCKEWAEGLSREAAFIQSDWSALGWALGSTRVLLDRREAPVRSLADLSVVARRFAESARYQTGYLIFFFGCAAGSRGLQLSDLLQYSDLPSVSQRVGCGMELAASIFFVIYGLIERRRVIALMREDDFDCTLFYKAELERSRDLLGSAKHWAFIAASLAFCIGAILNRHGGVTAHPVASTLLALPFMAMILAILLLVRSGRRLNCWRLEQLEALLAARH